MDLITFLTLVGYAKDVFSFCWKRLEFKELFTETGAAIATIYAKEATHDNDADQMIQILFSDSQMKTLAEKCDGKTGFDFLTFIEQYIRDFFAGYDLDAVDIEHLITEYTSEFESRLKNERPELYQQYFLQGFRLETRIAHQKAQESLDRIEKIITTHLGIEDGVFQFGISLDKIESRLMATTQPYEIDLMFFDYDEKNIDEQLTEALRCQQTLNVRFSSKEEGLYYILRVIKCFLPDLKDKVKIVETESDWNIISKIAKDLILIPMFTADRIDLIPGNKMISIYSTEDSCGKVQPIEVPRRTKSNLFNKLNKYLKDPEKTQNIIERTSGVYAALLRQLTCNNCVNKPAWGMEAANTLIPAALFGAWSDKEGDKELIARFTGIPYDDYIVIIRKYLEKEDPFLIRFEDCSGSGYRVSDPLEAIECIKLQINSKILEKFGECLLSVFIVPHSYMNEIGITTETGLYSVALKRGIAKTLIVMSLCDYAYGDDYGENLKSFVNRVINELMNRLHSKSEWEAVCEFIPLLIEAAPSTILAKFEECVAKNDEAFWSLFEPGRNSFFPNSMYVSILDALSLAMYLDDVPVRSLQVLESLAERNIVYKLGNTPISVLAETFSPALAIVDMSLERKVSLIKSYAEKYPSSCWLVLKEILAADVNAVSMVPNKPLYHLPKTISQKLTFNDVIDTLKQYYLIAFRCARKDIAKWADFFATGFFISYGFRDAVISGAGALVSDSNVNDEDKYTFEKAVRRFLHNQRFLGDNSNFKEEDLSYIELNLLNQIQYQDPIFTVLYAFDGSWLDIHPFTLDEEKADKKSGHFKNVNKYSDEQKRVLHEIFIAGRIKLCDLVLKVTDSYDLGQHIYETCHNSELQQEFAYFLFNQGKTEALRGYLNSALGPMDNESFFNTFKQVSQTYEEIDFKFKILTSHKIDEDFLLRLQALPQEMQNYFWKNIRNPWIAENDTSVIEEYLYKILSVGNCQDALDWTYLYNFSIETYIRILEAVLRFDTRVDAYQAQKIFEKIYIFEDIDETLKERILHLEESYAIIFTEEYKPKFLLDCLRFDPLHSVNNLYNIYGQNNNVENAGSMVAATNDASDTATVTTMEIAKRKAEISFRILFNIHFCPCEKDGNVDYQELDTWCESYLKAIKEKDITAVGETYLGQFLAYCPVASDGETWPLPAVCKAIEKYYTKELQDGFVVAVLNSRGTYSPHKGEEEKSLAQKYEDYAKVLEVSYPKSASIMRFISGVYRGDAKIQRSRAEHEYC